MNRRSLILKYSVASAIAAMLLLGSCINNAVYETGSLRMSDSPRHDVHNRDFRGFICLVSSIDCRSLYKEEPKACMATNSCAMNGRLYKVGEHEYLEITGDPE